MTAGTAEPPEAVSAGSVEVGGTVAMAVGDAVGGTVALAAGDGVGAGAIALCHDLATDLAARVGCRVADPRADPRTHAGAEPAGGIDREPDDESDSTTGRGGLSRVDRQPPDADRGDALICRQRRHARRRCCPVCRGRDRDRNRDLGRHPVARPEGQTIVDVRIVPLVAH